MGRRLFQRLQQGVEGLGREHVHFVDDVDLVARLDRGVAHALDQLADIADAGAAGRIHLDDIDMPVLGDGEAMGALAAGDGGGAALAVGPDAVEGAGEDARRRRLAHAAHAGQHIALGDAAAGDGIGQAAHQRLLPDHIGEGRGPVFPCQDTIGRRSGGLVGHRLMRGSYAHAELRHAGPRMVRERWEAGMRPARKLVTAASFRT